MTQDRRVMVAQPVEWWRADYEAVRDALGAMRAFGAPEQMVRALANTAETLHRAATAEHGATVEG